MNAHSFLVALAIVLGVAAFTTVVFQRLKQPVILGYILAGFIVGPNFPIPIVADRQIVTTLSELGVILVMFSLGLEFSLRKLFSLGPAASLTAVFEASLMIWLGFMTGKLLGWTTLESLFTGGIVAISSTTIIAKAFEEQKVEQSIRNFVVGILVVEDLIAIFAMTTLTAIASGSGLSAEKMLATTGRLGLFLIVLVGVGVILVPPTVRFVNRLERPETSLVAAIGFCFAVSLLAQWFGYSVALGAFLAGSLIAESGEHHEIERLVQPVRDVFAAIFFVSVGLSIEPRIIANEWRSIVVVALVVVFGKVMGVTIGAFFTGNSVQKSVRAGLSLSQIGEFSFIIAGLGLSLGVTRGFIFPVAVAVSALTTLTTPWLIKASGPLAAAIDRSMPGPLQTFVALYGSWLERFSSEPTEREAPSRLRRLIRFTIFDAVLLVSLAIGSVAIHRRAIPYLAKRLHSGAEVASYVFVGCVLLVAIPFGTGLVRVARRLGLEIAARAFPEVQEGKIDLASAPRRLFIVSLQLAILLLIGLPVLALTQPIFGGLFAPAIFGAALVVTGVSFWRSATNLEGHVQAGSLAIVEALIAQSRSTSSPGEPAPREGRRSLEALHSLLPGLGDPTSIHLGEGSPGAGRTLAELNLRGRTGATVLAIVRAEGSVVVPSADERLMVGDTLAVAGTDEAVLAASVLLTGDCPVEPSEGDGES